MIELFILFGIIIVLAVIVILLVVRNKSLLNEKHFTEEQVKMLLDRGQESGELKEEGRKMIDGIFELDDLHAYEIMTPRTDVFIIDLDDDRSKYIDELTEMTYSRIPVCEGDADNIIGMLHIKDFLLEATKVGLENVDIRKMLRPVYMVPDTKSVDSLLYELQKKKHHLAILIDEYGGFSGVVSIEDIVEQIVGDIDDEFDSEDHVINKVSADTYIVDGNVYLDDLMEATGISLESENSETIGGFIINIIGEIPKENIHYDPISFENCEFTILSVKDRRIEKLKLVINDSEEVNG